MAYQSQTALLGSLIDYAGTFPPAALPLDKAMERAASFRKGARHPWLMSKIVLPMADLKKISASYLYDRGADGGPWIFSALSSPAASENEKDVLEALDWDLREIARWNDRGKFSSLQVSIASYEMKIPATLTDVGPILSRVHDHSNGTITPFLEVGLQGEWESRLRQIADSMATWIEGHDGEPETPGIKIRTGGAYVPTSAQIAQVLLTVCSHGLRFKATQGLHSAITHDKQLGYVNLFAALNLLQSLGSDAFPKTKILECLETEKTSDFKFEKDAFRWRDLELSVSAIEAARKRHGGCFGSCSVDEPDEDLTKWSVK